MRRIRFCPAPALLAFALCCAFGAPSLASGPRMPEGVLRPKPDVAPAPRAARHADVSKATPPTVVAQGLRARAAAVGEASPLRVIVQLGVAPHAAARSRAREAERDELATIGAGLRAARRARPATVATEAALPDARRPSDPTRREAERAELRPWLERLEAAKARVRARTASEVRVALAPEHARVRGALEALGGVVEQELVGVPGLVARVPAGRLDAVAAIPGVVRVAADVRESGHLTNADDAVLVSAPGGPWEAGETGGVFDPAIVDNGFDRTNPLLEDDGARTNFWAWSLVAASLDPNFLDAVDEDDRQGHGTHVHGVLASKGSPAHPAHLGMAYGLEQVVHLKAGFCCILGNTAMYDSDRRAVIDLALYSPQLISSAAGATGTFADTVDAMNVSYGSSTILDETDASRFIDAVVHDEGLPFTISAGNTGPVNVQFSSPATSYNAITVGNVDDQGTPSRADDVPAATSTRGPTASGRRKPDIAAPGVSISAPSHDWETGPDVAVRTGTSQAAPMVLGVVIGLMDAGVVDPLEVKALVLNTATKNDAALDFESDEDGWDEALGWGYVNALAAYAHRDDVRSATVNEAGQPGDYRLFAGEMRDEGAAGEGRDRATLVWSRHVSYDAANPPSTFSPVSNLDLHLFREVDGGLVDDDTTPLDNVQQVRIDSGAPATDVVVRVDAADADFPHGGPAEPFALATEEDFSEVTLPGAFTAFANWPLEVEPGESFDVEFWIRNDDVLASHQNALDLALPAGFVLDFGDDPAAVDSAAGGGGQTQVASWTITAPLAPGPANLIVSHTHTSYLEPWGPFDWSLPITVAVDVTPPAPALMGFEIPPAELTTSQVSMRALTATDPNGPVEYLFGFTGSPSGGAGGLDSGWQSQVTYVNSGLEANHAYCFDVRARDAAQTPNETAPSPPDCDYTAIEAPGGVEIGAITETSIAARATSTPSNLALGSSGLRITNQTQVSDSGWQTSNGWWTSAGLAPNTAYTFVARARNGDAAESFDSPAAIGVTLAAPPANGSISGVGITSASAEWQANANPPGTEYLVENQTTAATSGWVTSLDAPLVGLSANTAYDVRVKARSQLLVETAWLDLPTFFTWAEAPVAAEFGARTDDTIEVSWTAGGNPPGTEYLAENVDTGTTSSWTTSLAWIDTGLEPQSAYTYRVKARNGDGAETGWVALGQASTLAPPVLPSLALWARLVTIALLAGVAVRRLVWDRRA